ncbi:MAG: 50S ribosomal protein L10 [Anaerolineae bacterium]|nr:MAG: 50S ribosomal protein L10 [Anaerolineae bacterium]
MALTKERKEKMIAQYAQWLERSEAVVFTEYTGLSMPALDKLRDAVRTAGGEFHIIKNTLAKHAFAKAGMDTPDSLFNGSSAIGIAFSDPPGVAKAILDAGKDNELIKIKGGFLNGQLLTAADMKALAELPPLPVVRSQLLAVINTPATQLARLLKEPGRQVAQVLKAYADKGGAAAAA